jgi:CRP/FNR family transcriptional regulator, cyclic AMP receptor protein
MSETALGPEIRDILLANTWFRELPGDLARALVGAATLRSFASGEVIHCQGDPSDALYAVVAGSVKVSSLSAEGRECVFRYLSPGNWFGEIGMLDGMPRTHDAVAAQPTRVLLVPPDALAEVLARHPAFYKFLSLLLCRVVRTAFTMLNDTTLLSVSARLAKRLLSFAEASVPTGGECAVHLTQEELATLVNATRQTVNKRLADWQKLGWIELRYARIVIRNPDALRQLHLDE